MRKPVKFNKGGETTDKESDKDKTRKLTTAEKVLSYPARVAILGGAAAGKAADQALYNSGLIDKSNPRFSKETREGRGYEEAKKLGRKAIGLDSLEEPEGKKKGGMATKSGVNAAGNYTKPGLRKKIVAQVKAAATHGTGAGKWSARKAQLVAKKYKQAGGGYRD